MTESSNVRPLMDDEPLSTDVPEAEAAAAPEGMPPRGKSRLTRMLIIGVLIAVVLIVGGRWLVYRSSHVSTLDSRIAAREITVSSQVSGRVTAVPIVAGDLVSEGDLLVGIETRQAELQSQEIEAELAKIDADIKQLEAQQAMVREQVASKLKAGQAALAAAEAGHRAAEAVLENAQSNYQRAVSMHKQKLISSQQFDQATEQFVEAEQQELRAAAGIETARADIGVIRSASAQIAVLDRQIASLRAQKKAEEARLAEQQIDLGRREIQAAFDGVIDQTFVDAGEYVAPGRRLLMYHDPDNIWVDANFKETEFRRLAIGAPVRITVDAYPDREFHGKVLKLGQAATSEFALLPSPNPSGNFTKVTQRLPVRIGLQQVNDLLRPGMMVEVTVDVDD